MSHIPINEDALFRAVTAFQHKVMAYYLDLRSGEITSRTLMPGEVQEPPPGPSVKPLPLLGGDLSEKKEMDIFGAPAPKKESLAGLFGDEGPKKKNFDGDFWKRDSKKNDNLFNDGGFRRESSSKKLAELFGEAASENESDAQPAKVEHRAPVRTAGKEALNAPSEIDYTQPLQRIPPASEKQHLEWLHAFAKDCGDPNIKEELQLTLSKAKDKHLQAFEKVLRKYQRMNQQWDVYYRKQARHYAEAWLKPIPVQWKIVESQ